MTASTLDHSFRPHILVDAIIQTMDRMHGLDISGYDPSFLDRTIDKRLQATGCRTREIYLADHLQTHTPEAVALHRSLRVGYSAFFRDSLTFALLENQVLPDLALPVMDGYAALAAIREDEDFRDIPVVAVTGSAMKGDREAILSRGFDGYVSKPINAQMLKKMIEKILYGNL